MSAQKIRVVWMCLVVTGGLYTGAAQAQSLFPTIYPKVYEFSCQGTACGKPTGTCTSTGPFVAFGTTGQIQFNSSSAGMGSLQASMADGASNISFGTAGFTFTAVNGTATSKPPASCTSSTTAACIPKGCASVTETLPTLKTVLHGELCFSHNGGEFSLVGTDVNNGTFVCHGNALTQ